MTTLSLDTNQVAENLVKAGASQPLAESIVVTFSDMITTNLASKDELQALRESLEGKFDGLGSRFEGLEGKFDGLGSRFEGLEGKFDGLEGRFEGLENRFDGLEGKFTGLEGRFEGLEGKFTGLEGKFTGIEGKFEGLEGRLVGEITALRGEFVITQERDEAKYKATDAKIDQVQAIIDLKLDRMQKRFDAKFDQFAFRMVILMGSALAVAFAAMFGFVSLFAPV